jgi:hypothetical protein
VVFSQMLEMPCENAGVAVGIGLDDLFARYAPLLRPGDVVYLPMEFRQYTATAAEYRSGMDGGFLIRHDRPILWQLSPGRVLGSFFCCTLSDVIQALIEMPVARTGRLQPETILASQYNEMGDRIDNDLALSDMALVGNAAPTFASPVSIARGYGTAIIARFVRQEAARGVLVVGGMPVGVDGRAPVAQRIALSDFFAQNGGKFLALPNLSRYKRADFFNGEDHLVRPCQFLHSMELAPLLAGVMGRPVQPLAANDEHFAETCPAIPVAMASSD